MPIQSDSRYANLHKILYLQFLDELDIEIQKEIMRDPAGDEAQLLNDKVEKAITAQLKN